MTEMAIVVGAGGGIGAAVAEHLLDTIEGGFRARTRIPSGPYCFATDLVTESRPPFVVA